MSADHSSMFPLPAAPARGEDEPEARHRAPAEQTAEAGAALTGHEYDGIAEYENPLPRWWVLMFWATFLFSIGYFFHYHIGGEASSVAEDYEADVRAAREAEAKSSLAEPVSEASLSKLMADANLMADAKVLFGQRCAPCHGEHAQGLIGPNLTDAAWLHGAGTLTDIYGVVEGGVPAKGMPAWGRQLTPIELRKVVAYVGTVRGTNAPGKAPEGNVVAPKP